MSFALGQNKSDSGSAKHEFEKRIERLVEKGRKRGLRFSIIGIAYSIIICALVLGFGYYLIQEISGFSDKVNTDTMSITTPGANIKRELSLPARWRQCLADNDCQETQNGCCNCQTGGKQTAINNQYLSEWLNRLGTRCTGTNCSVASNCHPGLVACKNKLCEFIASSTPDN